MINDISSHHSYLQYTSINDQEYMVVSARKDNHGDWSFVMCIFNAVIMPSEDEGIATSDGTEKYTHMMLDCLPTIRESVGCSIGLMMTWEHE